MILFAMKIVTVEFKYILLIYNKLKKREGSPSRFKNIIFLDYLPSNVFKASFLV
jgi:hypothetical protein